MERLTIERLAHEMGYRTAGVKEPKDGARSVTLKKGDRTVVIDDALIEDIVNLTKPLDIAVKSGSVARVA